MITRIVEVNLKADKVADARRAISSEVVPVLQRQPGFVDVIESLEPETGRFVCMSLWNSREDAERYGREQFPQIAEKMRPLIEGEPSVRTLDVENSTAHNISAGRAAA